MKSVSAQLIKVETATASGCSSPPWDLLPNDILPTIFKNLWRGDRVRSRLVCKSWKQILDHIPKRAEAPWQILSNDSYNKPEACLTEIRFRSITEQRIYRFRFINQSAGGWWCCGYSRGWLLITDSNADMFLWQPLSGDTLKLPHLSTLPFFNEYKELQYIELDRTGKIVNFSSVAHRVEVFSMDSTECVVAVIFRRKTHDEIAFCTPEEKTWKILGGGEFGPCYHDVLYDSTEKKLAIVATTLMPEHAQGLLPNDKIRLTNCEIPVRIIVIPVIIRRIFEDQFPLGLKLTHNQSETYHLVESTDSQKIIIVIAHLDSITSEKEDVKSEPIVRVRCQQIREFSVHVVNYKQSGTDYLSSIGAQTIFLGAAGSFLTPAVEGVEADCIHFAIDDAEGLAVLQDGAQKQYVVREHGVFSVQHHKIQQASFTKIKHFSGSKVGWFMPQL